MSKSLHFKVRGVTFENRQENIAKLSGSEPIQIVPEPENLYDENALAVYVAYAGDVFHIGYVPKENAALLAPFLDGEALTGQIWRMTGGFVKFDGSFASYGVEVVVDLPDETNPAEKSAGWEV